MVKQILVLVALVSFALVSAAYVYDVPRFVMGMWKFGRQRKPGTLEVGGTPSELSVHDLATTDRRSLNDWIGDKPLVLVFGSCT